MQYCCNWLIGSSSCLYHLRRSLSQQRANILELFRRNDDILEVQPQRLAIPENSIDLISPQLEKQSIVLNQRRTSLPCVQSNGDHPS
jgi:hypothetical protein